MPAPETLISLIRSRRDVIAAAMLESMRSNVRSYFDLPYRRQKNILEEIHYSITRITDLAPTGEPIPSADLDYFADIGCRWGLDGHASQDLQFGIQVAYVTGLKSILALATADMSSQWMELNSYAAIEVPRLLESAVTACAKTLDENGDPGPARDRLLLQLLNGGPAISMATSAGIELADRYCLLACHSPEDRLPKSATSYDSTKGLTGAIWGVQVKREGGTFIALIPVDSMIRKMVDQNIATIVQRLRDSLNGNLIVARSEPVSIAEIPDAYAEILQTLSLIPFMPDAQHRIYETRELLLEMEVARSAILQRRLGEFLEPLQDGMDLDRTVEILFECELDREKTARRLHVHRRTLTYRIQRIRELTGIDPASPHGIQLLRVALTAKRLSQQHRQI